MASDPAARTTRPGPWSSWRPGGRWWGTKGRRCRETYQNPRGFEQPGGSRKKAGKAEAEAEAAILVLFLRLRFLFRLAGKEIKGTPVLGYEGVQIPFGCVYLKKGPFQNVCQTGDLSVLILWGPPPPKCVFVWQHVCVCVCVCVAKGSQNVCPRKCGTPFATLRTQVTSCGSPAAAPAADRAQRDLRCGLGARGSPETERARASRTRGKKGFPSTWPYFFFWLDFSWVVLNSVGLWV